jgi:hypothetical protein
MYTHHKLDYDLGKIRGTGKGLDVETRRRLAESLALEMYRAKTLETDFHEHLRQLATDDKRLRAALERSGLTEEEIATDLAARSFVTVDDGTCRFIHKSFRGFFVARVLKEMLPKLDLMFDESLEDEVLYFLGGFVPTEKNIGQALWRAYRKTEPTERIRRRNLVVAILHTRPNFGRERIADTEIAEAEFSRLQFTSTQLTDVEWRDVAVVRLDLIKAEWKRVEFTESHIAEILIEKCELVLRVFESGLESWTCVKTTGSIEGAASTIDRWELESSSISTKLIDGSMVKELILDRSRLVLEKVRTDGSAPARIDEADLTNSRMAILGGTSPMILQARDSVVICASPTAISRQWKLKSSVLLLTPKHLKKKSGDSKTGAAPAIDDESLILAPDGATLPLLHTRAGVFGSFAPTNEEIALLRGISAWGVVQAEDLLATIKLPRKYPGCRVGDILLMRDKPHRELTAEELSAPRILTSLVGGSDYDPTDPDSLKAVQSLRHNARVQYEKLKSVDLPELIDFLPPRS